MMVSSVLGPPSLPNRPDEASIQDAQPVSFGGDLPSCQLRLVVLPPQQAGAVAERIPGLDLDPPKEVRT
jgi:hypothetical protein